MSGKRSPSNPKRALARDVYLRPFAERRRKIVAWARRHGDAAAATKYGISRQRVWALVAKVERAEQAAARLSKSGPSEV